MSLPDKRPLNILVLSVQTPFTRGGAEALVDRLVLELKARGHTVDCVQLPFSAEPKEKLIKQITQWRALELDSFSGKKVDLVISTKFPSYCVSHPNKVCWLIHQHRQLYELYGTRFGDFSNEPKDEAIRRMVYSADSAALRECRKIYTISQNVTSRLNRYLDIQSEVLNPPLPLQGRYYSAQASPYILYVGRICSIKRVDLLIQALPKISAELSVKLVGIADEPAIEEYLQSEISKHNLHSRVEFLGRVSDDELLKLYAECFSVYYAPYDEDYGFVTLEALSSNKPLVTSHDSGGVLEFAEHEVNSLITEPEPEAIAAAFNRLWEDEKLYSRLSATGAEGIAQFDWDEVIGRLLGTTKGNGG